MRISFFGFCLAVAICISFPSSAVDLYKVIRIVDGDTIQLNDGQVVRLIGVDTPEHHHSKKLRRDAERSQRDIETIQALGKQSTEFTRQLVLGKKVRIEYDKQRTDRYGRTLGYLFLPDGTFVNEEIIKQGYGSAYTKYPFKYMEQFRAAERNARDKKRGLWADGGHL